MEKTKKLTASFMNLPVNVRTDLVFPIASIQDPKHTNPQTESSRRREKERCHHTVIDIVDLWFSVFSAPAILIGKTASNGKGRKLGGSGSWTHG